MATLRNTAISVLPLRGPPARAALPLCPVPCGLGAEYVRMGGKLDSLSRRQQLVVGRG